MILNIKKFFENKWREENFYYIQDKEKEEITKQ